MSLMFLAEVNVLSSDDGPLHWLAVFPSLVPITVLLSKDTAENCKAFRLFARSTIGKVSFETRIFVPGTVLKKTSEYFVQWRDIEKGGMWGLNFMSENDAFQFLDICSMPQYQHSKLVQTPSMCSLYVPAPAQAQAATDKSHQFHQRVRRPTPVPEDNARLQIDPDDIFSVSSGASQSDPTVPRDFLAGLDPPKSTSSSKIGAIVGQQLDAAIFSQLEESAVDSDTDDDKSNGNNEYHRVSSEQNNVGNEIQAVMGAKVHTSCSALRSNVDAVDMNCENGCQYVESYCEAQHPPPAVFVTADWIPVPQRPVLTNIAREVNVTRFMTEILLPTYVNIRVAEEAYVSHSSGSSPAVYRQDVENNLSWARGAQVKQDWSDGHMRMNDMRGHVTDDSLMSNEPTFISQVLEMGGPKDATVQWVDDGKARTESSVTTITATSSIASAATMTASDQSRQETVPEISNLSDSVPGDVPSLPNINQMVPAGVQLTDVDDQCDGGDSEVSSMKTAVDEEDLEMISDTASSKNSSTYPRHEEPHIHHQAQMCRTGWLKMKTVLVQKNGKVAEAGKRKWKHYWATLSGTSLLLYQCDNIEQMTENIQPTAHIDVTDGMAQSVHEYLKKDFVFCLTINSGYAFYVQATNEADMESWISVIHCVSAAAVVKCRDPVEIHRTLKAQIETLDETIKSELQMKKLAELQLSTVTKQAIRSTITNQIRSWVENVERLNMDLYRLKCYMSAMQGTELPNPQAALANMSKATKALLGRLQRGFTVSSLHAVVCARRALQIGKKTSKDPTTPKTFRLKGQKSQFVKHSELLGAQKMNVNRMVSNGKEPLSEDQSRSSSRAGSRRGSYDMVSSSESDVPVDFSANHFAWGSQSNLVRVKLPNKQYAVLSLSGLTPMKILENKQQVNVEEHFVILRRRVQDGFETEIPDDDCLLEEQVFDELEVLQKVMHTVSMTKAPEIMFGFTAEAEVWESSVTSSYGSIVISQVDSGGLAELYGVLEGDEILMINETLVQDVGLSAALQLIEDANRSVSLSLMLRSRRIDAPAVSTTDNIISQLILRAPPSQVELTDDTLKGLLVPKPDVLKEEKQDEVEQVSVYSVVEEDTEKCSEQFGSKPPEESLFSDDDFSPPELSREQIDVLLKNTDELTRFVRSLHAYGKSDVPHQKTMTKEEKLQKCVTELVSTERTYVKNLNILLHRYLHPMKSESFLKKEDLSALFGNLEEIIPFQLEFLASLEESTEMSIMSSASAASVRNAAFSVAGTFLYYAEHFKLYSAFCASHTRAHEVLHRNDPQLQAFLSARNPKRELSSSLDSLLILPIQRVLRYPLFLKEMLKLTTEKSSEQELLSDAIASIETVANFINEVQRVYDCYHILFEMLLKDAHFKEPGVHVTIDELVHQCLVMWLNPIEDMQKGWKKGMGPEMSCFVFQTVIILLAADKDRKGKKKDMVFSSSLEDFRYRKLLLTSHASLEDLTDSDGVTNMWKLVHREPGTQTHASFFFRSSSREDKDAVVESITRVVFDRKATIQKMVSAITPGRRKRLSSSSFSTPSSMSTSLRMPVIKQPSSDGDDISISSVTSWSSSARTPVNPLRQFQPATEVLTEEYESYTDC